MAKFSEFMQHPRVAQMLNRLQGATPDTSTSAASAGLGHIEADVVEAHVEIDDEVYAPSSHPDHSTTTQDEIVTQEVTAESETEPELVWEDIGQFLPPPQRSRQRLLPMTTRVGVLGLVAVVMWWTWPRDTEAGFSLAPPWTDNARAGDLEVVNSLAVVNPANIEQIPGVVARAATATPETFFTNIVIVTPTSVEIAVPDNSDNSAATSVDSAAAISNAPLPEPIVLEASAFITGAQDATIVVEIPEAVAVEALMPALQSEPIVAEAQSIPAEIILLPTATPSPTPQAVAIVNSGEVPKVEIVPAIGAKVTPTPDAPTPTPTLTVVPTVTPAAVGPGRLWSTFTPLPPARSDHFWLGNPFADFATNRFGSPNYQFGSTAGNRYRPHHGLDFSNPLNTPVQSGVAGTIVHAGLDDPELLGPYANFYGKAVVIRLDQRLPVAGGEIDVFVLYGHLNEVRVEVGQQVQPADIVGLVGMTGIAIGPHLHVEARLGANTYAHSVNPYLWLKPDAGNGAVAVRVLTANGRTWAGAKVSIARFEGSKAVWARQIETYLDTENIGPDPLWGENGAMGDVPAGSYYLIANINGENMRAEFTVNAGETTFVEIRTSQ